MTRSIVGAALFVAGLPVAASAGYLLGLAIGSWRYRPKPGVGTSRSRLVVLVPAYNEAGTVGSCVESLLSQQYPRDLYRVVVIADNCTDDTAARAARAGAEVLTRDAPELRGKGHALRWAIDQLLADPRAMDALVVVDADTRADPGFVGELEARFAAGAEVVQADTTVVPVAGSARSHLEAAAVLLRNRVRYSGLMALGLPTGLAGNGMLFSRGVLRAHPWDAYSPAEDSEYTIKLLVAGVRPVFALEARVFPPPTPSERGAYTQGIRWEGGRLAAMTESLPRMLKAAVRRRDLLLLARTADLAVPPFTILVAATGGGTLMATLVVASGGPAAVLVPWAFAAAALPLYVVLGLRAAGAPATIYVAALALPQFINRKVRIYLHLLTHGREQGWVRTQRRGELDESGTPDG